MTYSLDFRKKVLEVREREGLSLLETSERFAIGLATVMRWTQRIKPCKTRKGGPRKYSQEALLKDVEKYPDAYHYERAKRLGVGKSTISRALIKMGLTYKKNIFSSQSRQSCKKSFSGKGKNLRKARA